MLNYYLEIIEATKQLNNVRVLNNFTLRVKKGELHAVISDSEIGMVSILKVLSGEYPYGSYSGDILIDGDRKSFNGIHDSEKAGIGIVYQKPQFVEQLDICENIFLGSEISRLGIIDLKKSKTETDEILNELGLNIKHAVKIQVLNTAERQKVEIARVMIKNLKIWIIEDLTPILTEKEIDNILELLKKIKNHGITIVYLAHRLKDILRIADRYSLMREGKIVYTDDAENYFADEEMGITHRSGIEISQNGIIDPFCVSYEISKREKEVLQKLVENYSNKEICEKLFISLNTLKTHIGSIYQKTKVCNRRELANQLLKFKRL